MKVIYLCGPYRADSEYGVHQNIQAAERVALDIWQAGAACICPHKNTAYFGGARGLPDNAWLEGDRAILRRCDAVVRLPGWKQSKGAVGEINEAEKSGLPVFDSIDELVHWINSVE